MTGLSLLTAELSGKRLDLLAQVVRSHAPRGDPHESGQSRSCLFLEETRIAAQKLGVAASAAGGAKSEGDRASGSTRPLESEPPG